MTNFEAQFPGAQHRSNDNQTGSEVLQGFTDYCQRQSIAQNMSMPMQMWNAQALCLPSLEILPSAPKLENILDNGWGDREYFGPIGPEDGNRSGEDFEPGSIIEDIGAEIDTKED